MAASTDSDLRDDSGERAAENNSETVLVSGTDSQGEGVSTGESTDLSGEFGRYQIEKLLGRGGMGAVYQARDTQLHRTVALKIPNFGNDVSPENIERFYREARAAATLSHPNICPVFDVGEEAGRHFISMGYIEGRPLSDYVSSKRLQPQRQVARIVRKLALALQDAHDQGIVHRDLKPANVMFDRRRNEPILTDFGLARQFANPQQTRLTQEGVVLGSPVYMSPEQLRDAEQVGPSTDIYSLGVTLYELLTGEVPFQGNVATVVTGILHDDPPSLATHRPDIDPALSAICRRAMTREIQGRFPSMKAFADALANYLKGSGEMETAVLTPIDDPARQRAEATSLIEQGDLRAAVAALKQLARDEGKGSQEVTKWAREQLPAIESQLQESVETSKSLLRRAKKSLAAHDYERTLQLLEQIPESNRTPAVKDLTAEARDLTEEVRSLTGRLRAAIEEDDRDTMLTASQRLLELKPNDRQASEVWEQHSPTAATRSLPTAPRPSRSRKRENGSAPLLPYIIGGGVLGLAVLLLILGGENEPAEVVEQPPPQVPQVSQPSEPPPAPRPFVPAERTVTAEPIATEERQPKPPPPSGRPDAGNSVRPDTNEPVQVTDPEPDTSEPSDPPRREPPPRPREDADPLRPPRIESEDSPAEVFAKIDRNEDGFITSREIPLHIVSRADRNRDNRISRPEFERALKEHGPALLAPPGGGPPGRPPRRR